MYRLSRCQKCQRSNHLTTRRTKQSISGASQSTAPCMAQLVYKTGIRAELGKISQGGWRGEIQQRSQFHNHGNFMQTGTSCMRELHDTRKLACATMPKWRYIFERRFDKVHPVTFSFLATSSAISPLSPLSLSPPFTPLFYTLLLF